jgi:predicted regulator of Ras-like GTPase activity (Roadblock/LC7/MglB family)
MSPPVELLDRLSSVRGIKGSVLVSAADGLIVAESLMTGVDGRAVAALAASLMNRMRRATACAGRREPVFLQLHAPGGTVLAAPCGAELVLVAIAGPDVNVGLARLEMLDAAGRLA